MRAGASDRIAFTDAQLVALADRASTLWERLGYAPRSAGGRTSIPDWRLQRWCEIAADGDEARFATRLARNGIDRAAARLALAAAPPRIHGEPPAWAVLLNECVAAFSASARCEAPDALLDPAAPLPFEEVFAPFVSVASAQVVGGCAGLERQLLERLTGVAAESLYVRFSVFRWDAAPAWLAVTNRHPRALYLAFVDALRGGALIRMLIDMPVLARLLGVSVLQWIDATAEFLGRLRQDAAEVHARLGTGGERTQAVRVDAGLSDPHDGGRTVIRVTFASGLRVLYKPRSLALESGWARLQASINLVAPDTLPALAVTRVVEKAGYGWMEFVEQQACLTPEEAARFYTRAGMLHYLFLLLGSADCHMGNIVVRAEYPTLVDGECVRQPAGEPEPSLEDQAFQSGFLPVPFGRRSPDHPDLSGLTGRGGQAVAHSVGRWQHTNTDAMTLTFVRATIAEQKNRPWLDGQAVAAAEHATEASEGFMALHRLFERHEGLLATASGVDGAPRRLLRSTRDYVAILNRSLRPSCLRDGLERSLALDELARAYVSSPRSEALWPFLAQETRALEQLDIPRIYFPARDPARAVLQSRCDRLRETAVTHATLLRAVMTVACTVES